MPEAPNYVHLYESGELEHRVSQALASLESCRVCRSGRLARVASSFPHFGEEDCLRGWNGSGTIFFAWCNLRCVFCQNFDFSQQRAGRELEPEELASLMLELQQQGCHNINFVTPEHVVPQILEALPHAIRGGLRLPIVYNTSAFDSAESLRHMEGIVDIYMPDFKCWRNATAQRYLKSPKYPDTGRAAITEMHRQVGQLQVDDNGLATRGVLVRHLVMPGGLGETGEIMRFLAGLSADTYVNIMAQYRPAGKVDGGKYAEIDRMVSREEMRQAYRHAREAGLHRFDERTGVVARLAAV